MTDIIVKDFNIEPFASLRTTPWEPSFDWVEHVYGASKQINSFHENGNDHIVSTGDAILELETVGEWTDLAIIESVIKRTHAEIFPGEKWTGKWRDVRVRVGPHRAPHATEVPYLMDMLLGLGTITIQDLALWYYAFETIHPFQDGNGRVGGAIVAAYSHLIEPDKGYLAPNQ